MLGLDQIGGIWQEIGEVIIILIMCVINIWFWGEVTRTAQAFLGVGQDDIDTYDYSDDCKHEFERNMITRISHCTKCNMEVK